MENKKCPRCGSHFKCNNGDILNCACITVPIDGYDRQVISEKYDDCLCRSCLLEIHEENAKIMQTH